MTGPFRTPANRASLARGHGLIAAQREAFLALADAALAATDDIEAVAVAQAAYGLAHRRHPGILTHSPLESLVGAVGRRHVPGAPARPVRQVRSVLHVATEIYESGGHTRVLERWIERDTTRRSTVMLLRQVRPLPAATAAAAARCRAAVVRPAAHANLLERARHLRALAELHDLVVLHVHPFETIAALAFADPAGRPPVVFFNHASHQLWLGVGSADVVASLWAPDQANAITRRGVAPPRSVVLPLPTTPLVLPDRDAARAALGVPDTALVLAVVGSSYKLQRVVVPTFADVCSALLAADDRIHIVAAGPDADDVALPRHPRLRAIGVVADLGPLLAGADALLDTWPASGATVLIDAVAAGLPIVSLGSGDAADSMIRPPQGLYDGVLHVAPTIDALVAAAIACASGPRPSPARDETDWSVALENVVATALAQAGAAALPLADDPGPVSDAEAVLALLFEHTNGWFEPPHAYAEAAADLPPHRRPSGEAEIIARVEAIVRRREVTRAQRPRAVAAPPVEPLAIVRLIAEVRRRVAADEIGACVVVVPEPSLQTAIALLEAALATGPDVAIDLVAGDIAAVAQTGDIRL